MSVRDRVARVLSWVTGLWVLVELLSLRLGILNAFFFDAQHADVQGIDYYSLPKAWLLLAAGRSPYDSFGPPSYGPHLTWYLSHPALALWLGSWLSWFTPENSYGVFVMLSLAMMAACAWLLARESSDALTRAVIWLLLLGAFPTYWMLFVGNVQALLVLALTLLFVGILRVRDGRGGRWFLFAGLLLSLLSKPVVLLMLPLLLLLPESRKAAVQALGIYVVVSALFEFVPALNPEGIGFGNVLWLAVHPQYVREHMNIYANQFQVTAQMKDNSIHWFNLIAQSGFRFEHVDVYSLPIFLDGLLHTETPLWLYALPTLTTLVLTVLVARMPMGRQRLDAALLLLLGISATFFLGYPTVWEYQYTSLLPVAAVLLLLHERKAAMTPGLFWGMFVSAACAWLPSLYVFTQTADPTPGAMTLIRVDRVVPALVLFVLLMMAVVRDLRSDPLKEVV